MIRATVCAALCTEPVLPANLGAGIFIAGVLLRAAPAERLTVRAIMFCHTVLTLLPGPVSCADLVSCRVVARVVVSSNAVYIARAGVVLRCAARALRSYSVPTTVPCSVICTRVVYVAPLTIHRAVCTVVVTLARAAVRAGAVVMATFCAVTVARVVVGRNAVHVTLSTIVPGHAVCTVSGRVGRVAYTTLYSGVGTLVAL